MGLYCWYNMEYGWNTITLFLIKGGGGRCFVSVECFCGGGSGDMDGNRREDIISEKDITRDMV